MEDMVEDDLTDRAHAILGPQTTLHKQFFVENIKLARLGMALVFLSSNRLNKMVGVRFLELCEGKPVSPGIARDLADTLVDWRESLPEELLITRIAEWTTGNVWIIFLLAMGFRLECLVYRTVRHHMKGLDFEAVRWSSQRLMAGMFELDTLLRRAMVHDVIKYCPPSLYVFLPCAHVLERAEVVIGVLATHTKHHHSIVLTMNLLAFQIEIILDPDTSMAQRLAAKAQLHTGLNYFCSVRDRWKNATWAFKVIEWAIARVNLIVERMSTQNGDSMQDSSNGIDKFAPSAGLNDGAALGNGHGAERRDVTHVQDSLSGDANDQRAISGMDFLNGLVPQSNGIGFDGELFDGLMPDNFIQGLVDGNLFDDFDTGMFSGFAL